MQGSICPAKTLSCPSCVQDVKGHILEFCKDQTGSRFIQQALDKDATPEQVPPRYSCFDGRVGVGLPSCWRNGASGEEAGVCTPSKCRRVQMCCKGVEPLLMPQVKDVAAEAKHRFAMLMEDVFGNYVVQKLLERAAAEDKKWMAERICRDHQKPNQPNRAVVLSKHQYGCRVVQKALEVGTCPAWASLVDIAPL